MSNSQFYEQADWERIDDALPPRMKDYLAQETAYFRQHLSGGRVLDAGCGNGRSLEEMKDIIEEGHGIDLCRASVRNSRDRLPDYHFVQGSVTEMPYPDEYFDTVILSFNLLGNLNGEKKAAIEECRRVLKPGGKILFSTYSEDAGPTQEHTYRQLPGFTNIRSNDTHTLADTADGSFASERFTTDSLESLFKDFSLTTDKRDFTYLGTAFKTPRLCPEYG